MSVFFPKFFYYFHGPIKFHQSGINLKLKEKIGKDPEAALSHLHVIV